MASARAQANRAGGRAWSAQPRAALPRYVSFPPRPLAFGAFKRWSSSPRPTHRPNMSSFV